MPRLGRDPYWTTAIYRGKCRRCSKPIAKGDRIFYYPNDHRVLCEKPCGAEAARDFSAHAFDEFVRGI